MILRTSRPKPPVEALWVRLRGRPSSAEAYAFYKEGHPMFWLVHIHSDNSFLGFNFGISMDFTTRPVELDGKTFAVMRLMGRSVQFIEKRKRASAHVFFDFGGHILYFASERVAQRLGGPFQRGEFALCKLTRDEFIRAVLWAD